MICFQAQDNRGVAPHMVVLALFSAAVVIYQLVRWYQYRQASQRKRAKLYEKVNKLRSEALR